MAGGFVEFKKTLVSKQKNVSQNVPTILNLDFDGELQSEVCGELVIGMIKYLLYQREQIPEMYDTLASRTAGKESNSPLSAAKIVRSVASIRNQIQEKKTTAFVKVFNELFDHLRNMFSSQNRIPMRRIAFLIGSAPVTPLEIHCIEFPWETAPVRSPGLSIHKCLAKLFRTLFMSSSNISFPRRAATNIAIMLEMSRSTAVTWFIPKTYFQLPKRGRHFEYRISWPSTERSSLQQNHTHPVSSNNFEIYESPNVGDVNQAASRDMQKMRQDTEDKLVRNEACRQPPNDFIWFQMPHTAKGLSLTRSTAS